MPEEHARTGLPAGPRRCRGQRGLALAGLTGDQDQVAALVLGRPMQCVGKLGQLDVAFDDSHSRMEFERPGERRRSASGVGQWFPQHLDRGDRLGQALQFQESD